jgi:putative nucleotidyltransferase with HDIG domain
MLVAQIKTAQLKISADELAALVEKAVLDQVNAGRISLPAMPRVAARAFALLRKRDFSLADVAAVIETDPVVAARLVHLANSVAFATASKLSSVVACVTRLGGRELSFFLMETAARHLVACHDPRIARMCDGLWEHSLSVAILSHDLVVALPGLDAETAYLGGLLHDLGRPLVAEMLLDAERRLLGKRIDHWIMPAKWLDVIVRCERSVGLALARAWTLPDEVVDAVAMCCQYDVERPFRLANVVRLADGLAAMSGHDLTAKPEAEVAATVADGSKLLGLAPEAITGIVNALPERLAGRMS